MVKRVMQSLKIRRSNYWPIFSLSSQMSISRLNNLRHFSWYHNILGVHDKSSQAYKTGKHPVDLPLPDHNVVYLESKLPRVQLSTLSNGVKVLTETAPFPNSVYIGVLIEAGTRDETLSTSGTLMALKNTYLKTNTRTNEQINYGMIQMSGGDFTMDYTQEMMYYQGHCLPHDTYDFLQMISDCVLDDKTLMDEQAAHWRIDEFWKLRDEILTPDQRLKQMPLAAAYGLKGLGMPLVGFQSKFQNIGYSHLNHFRKTHITPDKITVCGAGIQNHEDFVNAVRPYYENLEPCKPSKRVPSKYIGGQLRENFESDLTYMNLSFEGVSWKSKDLAAIQVLRQAVGDGGGFSAGGPGKGMHSRVYTQILQKYPFIDSVQAVNHSFTDSGVFGLNLIGLNEYCGYMTEAIIRELIALTSLSDVEVKRAKNLLKIQILQTLEKTSARLEDTVKGSVMFGLLPQQTHYYLKMIDDVTPDAVRKLVVKVLRSQPSLVVIGGDTHAVPSLEKIASRFK